MSQIIIETSPPPCNGFFCKIHQYLLSVTSIPNPIQLISPLVLISNTLNSQPLEPIHRAESSFHTLQQWYNSTSGLYTTTGWWNSANLLTTLSNLASLDPNLSPQIQSIFQNSFEQAPKQNSQSQILKIIHPETMLIETTLTKPLSISKSQHSSTGNNGFLNNYYDDEGWWALTWLQTYTLTSHPRYLSAAIIIFSDMRRAENTTPCNGGIWWDKSQTYVNAIANELYLSVAAHLANRVPASEKEGYVQIARRQWEWFEKSGMVNAEGTVDDGLEVLKGGGCRSNGGTVWSYNQGVVVSGLVELFDATGEEIFLRRAVGFAEAAIKRLGSGEDGVLRDVCEDWGCGADGVQFKGVFLRGVMRLLEEMREGDERTRLESFVRRNAESIWENDRNESGGMGVSWQGPVREVNAGSHGSALDALTAHVSSSKTKIV